METMLETFALTNISPQVGRGFNRDYWARFERFVNLLTRSCNDVFVVTGPLYLPTQTPKGYVLQHPMIGKSSFLRRFCCLPYPCKVFCLCCPGCSACSIWAGELNAAGHCVLQSFPHGMILYRERSVRRPAAKDGGRANPLLQGGACRARGKQRCRWQ